MDGGTYLGISDTTRIPGDLDAPLAFSSFFTHRSDDFAPTQAELHAFHV